MVLYEEREPPQDKLATLGIMHHLTVDHRNKTMWWRDEYDFGRKVHQKIMDSRDEMEIK